MLKDFDGLRGASSEFVPGFGKPIRQRFVADAQPSAGGQKARPFIGTDEVGMALGIARSLYLGNFPNCETLFVMPLFFQVGSVCLDAALWMGAAFVLTSLFQLFCAERFHLSKFAPL
jgi:hypothetical protein